MNDIKSAGFDEVKVIGDTGFAIDIVEKEPALKAIVESENISRDDLKKGRQIRQEHKGKRRQTAQIGRSAR